MRSSGEYKSGYRASECCGGTASRLIVSKKRPHSSKQRTKIKSAKWTFTRNWGKATPTPPVELAVLYLTPSLPPFPLTRPRRRSPNSDYASDLCATAAPGITGLGIDKPAAEFGP